MVTVGKPLVASARRVRYSKTNPPKLTEETWQDRAWEVYDRLGEVFYMTRYRAGIARKLDYFVALQENVTDDPEPLETGPAVEVFIAEGGPQMLRRIVSELMPHWDVPGEGYLVGFEDSPKWRVFSTQELKKQSGGMFFYDDEGSKQDSIDEEKVWRVWRPHPRWSTKADSPTKHILEVAEELILSSREVRARSMSRLSAGVWLIPEGLDLEAYEEEDGSGLDGFANELVRKMSAPIKDPGDPQSLVPWVIEMSKDDIEVAAKGLVSFAREFKVSTDQRKELLIRLANGLDLPAEILLGVADLNHWSAWLVTESAVNQHAVPSIDDILDSLTYNWFYPILEASGVDTSSILLWRDIAPAVVPPDRSANVFAALDHVLISDEAARRHLDFDEDDAPSPEEMASKTSRVSEVPSEGPPELALTAAAVQWRIPPPLPPVPELLVASELAEIDRGLFTWTVAQAEATLDRVLDKVGFRLKSAASGNGAKDLVKNVEPGRVASVLGPTQVGLLAATTQLVSEEDFAAFSAKLSDRIEKAQSSTRDYIARLTGFPVPEDPSEPSDRGAGVALTVASLVLAAESAMFKPDISPDPVDVGELADTTVPVRKVREGLSVAGGGMPFYDGTNAQELVGNGKRANDLLAQRGWTVLQYEWDYGDPSSRVRNFEPHQRLNGVQFASWDDDVLSHSGWPGGHLRPQDHAGCMCSFVKAYCAPPILGAGEENPCGPPGLPLAQETTTLSQDDFLRALGPRSKSFDPDAYLESRRILSQSDEGSALLDFVDKWLGQETSGRYRNQLEKYMSGSLTGAAKKRVDALFSAMRKSPGLPAEAPLHRGLAVRGKIENVMENYKVGDTLDLNLSSFTSDRSVATRYAKARSQNIPSANTTKIMIEWDGLKRGVLPLENVSPDARLFRQREWVGGGRFEIIEVKRAAGGLHVKIRQVEELTVPT